MTLRMKLLVVGAVAMIASAFVGTASADGSQLPFLGSGDPICVAAGGVPLFGVVFNNGQGICVHP